MALRAVVVQAVVATKHTRDRTPAVDVDKEDAVVGEVGRVGLCRRLEGSVASHRAAFLQVGVEDGRGGVEFRLALGVELGVQIELEVRVELARLEVRVRARARG